MDQPKFERMLRLMKLMTGNTTLSVEDLARRLDTTYRSVYRYIDTFKEAGFAVQKIRTGVYQLVTTRGRLPDFSKIVYFSDEEAGIVNALIEGLDNSNTLKANLKQKLSAIYDTAPVTDFVEKRADALNVRELSDAIRAEKVVVLHDYKSSHALQRRDRRIEPFAFTSNYIHVWGYDLEDGRCKTFGISRIAEVEVTADAWTHAAEHVRDELDIFRMPGKRHIHAVLLLDMMAVNLLLEEYPAAASELRQATVEDLRNTGLSGSAENWRILDTKLCALQAAGRFTIGLADHIRIVDAPELSLYIKEFTKSYLMKEMR